MKNMIKALLLGACLAIAPALHAGSFGGEKIVSSDGTVAAQYPEVAYANGVIHVVFVGYSNGNAGEIYYSRSTTATGNFSAPVNLSNSPASGNDHPHVAATSDGRVYVAWETNSNTGAVVMRRSLDGGLNFEGQVPLADSGPSFYSRITHLFADSANRIHLAYYDNGDTGGVAGQVHHRMTCDGTNWGADVAVTNMTIDGDVDNEQPRVGEANGKFHIVFRSSRNGNPQGGLPPYSIQMQTGTLNPGPCTVTWQYPARRVANGLPYSFATSYRPTVYGDSNNNLHLAWWDNDKGANVAYRKAGTNGLLGAAQTVSNFGVDHLEPGGLCSTNAVPCGGFQMPPAVVSNGTTAFMAYYRNSTFTNGAYENGPIYLRESADNGATWGAEQLIPLSGQAATTPRMALDRVGNQNVAVVWADIRSGSSRVYYRLYTLGALSGGPSFSVSPNPATFGSQQVGTTSAPLTLTVLNSGTAGNITGISIAGADFTRTGGSCPASSGALGAGASCTINVTFTAKAFGARTGTVTVNNDSIDGPATAQLTGTGTTNTGASAFSNNVNGVVWGYYETILGRVPDGPGAAFWAGEANRVTALQVDVREVFFAMSVQFFTSAEYLNKNTSDTQYVTDLYRTFFVREPDSGGLNFWLSQMAGGMDRGAVLNNFLFSAEFSNFMTGIFGVADVRPESTLTIDLYRGILGNLPDDGGFNFWRGQIRQAQCQGATAVTNQVATLAGLFVGSAQYQARDAARPANLRNAMHVGDLYNAFLRRGGDLGGYNFWVNQLNTGAQSRDQVRAAFVGSAEFQARVQAVINAGCFPGP